MRHDPRPPNLRVYGVLLRRGRVLIAAEYVGAVFCWKFPGGGVERAEGLLDALRREWREETGLEIEIGRLLHAPGTLMSPWTGRPYTPVYFAIAAQGAPRAPAHEPVAIDFRDPAEALESGLMAAPERLALRRALAGMGRLEPDAID